MIFKDDSPVAESDEERPGTVLDYDTEANLVSIEIFDASKRVTDARKVDYKIPRSLDTLSWRGWQDSNLRPAD